MVYEEVSSSGASNRAFPGSDVPNVARMYDFYLGGKDNYEADRRAAEQVLAAFPEVAEGARSNREFLGRAVRYVAEAGIRQFVDIGTGLPTQENVHQVALSVAPDARVVYCDNDPMVSTHAEVMLARHSGVAFVPGDLRHPRQIFDDLRLWGLIDLSQPVCVLLVAIMHFITEEEDPRAILDAIRETIAPGSYLVLSHATVDSAPADRAARVVKVYRSATSPVVPRTHQQVTAMFEGFDLTGDGVVDVRQWKPEPEPDPGWLPQRPVTTCYGGVGRKPPPAT